MQNGQVTGLVLSPKGAGFQNAGFQSGDIVTQVNGRPIRSAGDLQALQNQIVPGARISLMVERGAAVVPIALTLQRSEEHTSELQSLMRNSYAVFCLQKKIKNRPQHTYDRYLHI